MYIYLVRTIVLHSDYIIKRKYKIYTLLTLQITSPVWLYLLSMMVSPTHEISLIQPVMSSLRVMQAHQQISIKKSEIITEICRMLELISR